MFSFNLGDPAATTLFVVSYIVSILVSLGVAALMMVSCWHIFKKLGMPGWKGIIPYYSDYMLFKTLWKTKPFWVLVISSGAYLFVTLLMSIALFFVMLANMSSESLKAVEAFLIVFAVVIGVLTIALMVIAIVLTFMLHLRLAKAFGKGTGYAFGLTFISVVFYPILAFGKAQRVSDLSNNNN